MRRKAKELQQARRDAERSGKKVPAFGGFGSAGMTSVSSGSIITDTIVEPEKPKITPAPVRYYSEKYMREILLFLNISFCCCVGCHYGAQGLIPILLEGLRTEGVACCADCLLRQIVICDIGLYK